MKIVEGTINKQYLLTLAKNIYGDMIKDVVDIDTKNLQLMPNYIPTWKDCFLNANHHRMHFGDSISTQNWMEKISKSSIH